MPIIPTPQEAEAVELGIQSQLWAKLGSFYLRNKIHKKVLVE
jgi:hypothetical protein